MPYQKKTFVTPAFPGYISGHSTFSRAAAEAVTAFTGSKWFPNGLGTYTITKLANEVGPTQPVTLQWASYYDAADQVGLSRIWGGIHPPVDDFAGRRVGAEVGTRPGSSPKVSSMAPSSIPRLSSQHARSTIRTSSFGSMPSVDFTIKFRAPPKVEGPYTDGASAGQVALEASVASTNALGNGAQFFRVSALLAP